MLMQALMLMLIELVWTLLGGGPSAELYPPQPGTPTHIVDVVSNGWHTGLVVRLADLPDGLIPERVDFEDYRYLEIGWGDRGFYQADTITLPLALKAALWPTPSVMHMAAFDESVNAHYHGYDHIRLKLTDDGYRRMILFVDGQFARNGRSASQATGSGLYDYSFFYPGRANYDWHQSCNVWTARALRHAGCPVITTMAVTAEGLMSQVAGLAGAETHDQKKT